MFQHEHRTVDLIRMIRADRRYKSCLIYTLIENKYPTQAAQLGHFITVSSEKNKWPCRHFISRTERLKDPARRLVGVGTGSPGFRKIDYVDATMDVLQTDRLKFDEKLVGPDPVNDKAECHKQLRNLERKILPASNALAQIREGISGKGYEAQDDLAIVFMLGVCVISLILQDEVLLADIRRSHYRLLAE